MTLTNFLAVVSDASVLLRDIAGDAATNAATKVRPDEEKLSQIDRPADDNTWHEAPNFSKDNLKKQLQNSYKGNDPAADASVVAENAVQATQATGDAYSGVDAAKQTAQNRTGATDEDTERVRQDAEKAKQASKKKAEEYRVRTREYLSRKMPQERRDQTIWRLKVRGFLFPRYFTVVVPLMLTRRRK